MLSSRKKLLIEKIFSQKKVFEEHVLAVHSDHDRAEVMEILAERLIDDLLKYELNFLYMKDLKKFQFSLIVNLLFHELADEWVAYAKEVLLITHADAVEALQTRAHTLFLVRIVKEYFKQYKLLFVERIAESFISLVDSKSSPRESTELIEEVLKSDFVKSDKMAVVHSFSQLWGRVKSARNFQKERIAKIQIKIAETSDVLKKREYEREEEQTAAKSLAFFDDAVSRLRNTMVTYMMSIESYSPKR